MLKSLYPSFAINAFRISFPSFERVGIFLKVRVLRLSRPVVVPVCRKEVYILYFYPLLLF